MLSPVPCWHFSMMTRKSLPSWPQCWAPYMTVETVTMFQQSHQTVLKVTGDKGAQDGRHSRAVSPGAECWAESYCFARLPEEWASCGEKRVPRPLLGRHYSETLWQEQRKICFIVSGQTVLQFQRVALKKGMRGSVGSLQA